MYQHRPTDQKLCIRYIVGVHKRFVIVEHPYYFPTVYSIIKLYGLNEHQNQLCLLDQVQLPACIRGYFYWVERNYLLLYSQETENFILKFESDKIEIVSKPNISDTVKMHANNSFVLPNLSFLQEASTVLNPSLIAPLVQLVQQYLVFELLR